MRYIAEFSPQAWVRDNAIEVDAEGPTGWDVTEFFLTLPEAARTQMFERGEEPGHGKDHDDLLWKDPNAPEWIRNWSGPFDTYVWQVPDDIDHDDPVKLLEELRKECEYSDGDDGEESSVDDLIGYKDALEDLVGRLVEARKSDKAALDELNLLLSAPEWPGASGMEDVCDIVRATGREEIPNAPGWQRH